MLRACIIIVVTAVLIGTMLRNPDRDAARPSSERENAFQQKAVKDGGSKRADLNAEAVELRREDDGHFYADAAINGVPVRVLVDTGASGIALSRDDARRAGLPVSVGMFEVVGEGAGGKVRGEYVTLDSVSLGATSVERVPAVVLDGGEMSLLGQSFLKQFDSVEIRGDTMVLR